MSNYRRANTKGGAYFFTVVAYRRQEILCDENIRIALRNGIRNVQKNIHFISMRGCYYRIISIAFGLCQRMMRNLVNVGR